MSTYNTQQQFTGKFKSTRILHYLWVITMESSKVMSSSSSPSTTQKLPHQLHHHFVLVPLMSPGHLLPMVDIARLLSRRNLMKVTIMTTPLNADRVRANIDREILQSGSSITVQHFRFPSAEAGLPEGCESLDTLPSVDLFVNFAKAVFMLQDSVEQLFEKLCPNPTCVIFDRFLPFVSDIAEKFGVPRITFDGTNCFTSLCNLSLRNSKVYQNVSDSEPFVVPGLPHRVVFRKSQLPEMFTVKRDQDMSALREKSRKAEEEAYGVIMNSFEELEEEYVKEYKRVTGRKIWCIGPVSLCNKDAMDKAQRSKPDSNKEEEEEEEGKYVKWLDSWPARTVIYVCLGSLNRVTPEQLMELGLGLEATNRPFILVLRGAHKREEMEKKLKEEGLEERVKGRGIIIRGWVPQVLILSHTAIGAFLTHCGWNTTLEGICSGVPLITFPLFAEQFYNEKVVVQLLEIGVMVGVENGVPSGEEDKYGVQVKREKVKEAIEKVMSEEDEESERIRERAKMFAEKAKKAMEIDGSSYLSLSLLIEDITQKIGMKID